MSIGFASLAEDLEWLREAWCEHPDRLSDADVRRGAATLRRLLLDRGQGAILAAWRRMGFTGQPIIVAPDVLALLDQTERPVENVVSLVAGGAPVNGIHIIALSVARVAHPRTGVPADADEGFAVATGSIVRKAGGEPEPSDFDPLIQREWPLADYLTSVGAIRLGKPIRRLDIIQFICKDGGGVHVDDLFGASRQRSGGEELADDLHGKVKADWRNGLIYELLSIGYCLGRSADLARLAIAIREAR